MMTLCSFRRGQRLPRRELGPDSLRVQGLLGQALPKQSIFAL